MSRSSITTRIRSHPGEVLREEFMKPLGLSANRIALDIRVPANRISMIAAEKRGITPETALRLARYFGTTAEFWMNLQVSHDLSVAMHASAKRIGEEVKTRVAGTSLPGSNNKRLINNT